MADTGEATKTYRGNCHCGAFIFEVKVPEIKSIMNCNCSICVKKAYMWIYPPKEAFTVVKDDGVLTEYSFGSKKITHKFCSKCGISVLGALGDSLALNARTIQNLDQWKLDVQPFDGASLGSPYEAPAYNGPEPSAAIENADIYHGSCHCGAVKVAVKLPEPLDGNFKEEVFECNCSICMRAGFTWIYPKREQVAFDGAENLARYAFNEGVFYKSFCKTCGVYFTNEVAPKTDLEVSAFSEGIRGIRTRLTPTCPFNIRVLNNFDFGAPKPQHIDTWSLPPPYKAP